MTSNHPHKVSETLSRNKMQAQEYSLPASNGRDDSLANIDETQPLLHSGADGDPNWIPRHQRSGYARSTTLEAHDDEAYQGVLRKIDRVIIPLLFVTYMFSFMDKAILSSAAVFGLREDNNLRGQEYSWVGSMFYVGYLLWEYPTSILITRLPTAKYLAANTVFWGAVVALTASCSSFTGLMTVRFLLGVAESTITPGFMFLTSTWYTRDEMPTRLAIWFAGNSIGGLCSSLLAYGVGNLPSHADFKPWRWMYIILGTGTLLWAIPLFLFLPDSITKAKFLNEKERRLALERVLRAGTGITENARWKLTQAKECLIDPKTWLILSIELFTQIPNGGTHSFSNIVITSFGFTDLESTLINIPYSITSALIIYGTGWLAGRYRTLNCLLIITAVLPCIIGSAVIYHRDKVRHGVQLMAYFFLSSGPAAMPLNMSLVQANYRGVTKKMTITAMMFGTYCVGNIIGPQFFRASEAPTYDTAFRTIMVCYTLVSILALALRVHLQRANSRKPMEDGVLSIASVSRSLTRNATADGAPSESASHRANDNDTTDWETIGFRYRL